eukprot:1581048-Lingulodinium_polyedra.AAC.1
MKTLHGQIALRRVETRWYCCHGGRGDANRLHELRCPLARGCQPNNTWPNKLPPLPGFILHKNKGLQTDRRTGERAGYHAPTCWFTTNL